MIILPIQNRYLPPLMIVLGIIWILEIVVDVLNPLKTPIKYRVLLYFFLIYFFWQLLGILYTSDVKMGWANIFGRLSLIVFPIIIFSPTEKVKTKIYFLLKTFAVSTTIYIIVCILYAFIRSLSIINSTWVFNPHPQDYYWLNYFYGMDFTLSIHPSYLAMYVLLSFFIAIEASGDQYLKMKHRVLWIINSLFLLISLYFISSRAGILAAFISIPYLGIQKFIKTNRYRLLWLVFMFLLIPVSIFVINKNLRIQNIFKAKAEEQKTEIKIQDDRLKIWKSAINIISDNLIVGVGIGDVRDELVKEYNRQDEIRLSENRLNAHNQFLEVFIENGLIGFVIFLSLISFMIYLAISEANLIYGLFILMMIVFFMFETTLYRLAGVSFFSLFSFLLLYYKPQRQKE